MPTKKSKNHKTKTKTSTPTNTNTQTRQIRRSYEYRTKVSCFRSPPPHPPLASQRTVPYLGCGTRLQLCTTTAPVPVERLKTPVGLPALASIVSTLSSHDPSGTWDPDLFVQARMRMCGVFRYEEVTPKDTHSSSSSRHPEGIQGTILILALPASPSPVALMYPGPEGRTPFGQAVRALMHLTLVWQYPKTLFLSCQEAARDTAAK